MINFTKKLFFAVFFLLSITAFGQTPYAFEVTAPASIAGSYEVLHSTYGPKCEKDTLVGPLMFIEDDTEPFSDGCTATTQDLSDAIVFIDRGICDQDIKVLNAQDAGAMAVIICNNTDDPIVNSQGVNDAITIHSFMMSQNDCATIRTEIENASGTLSADNIISSTLETYWEEKFTEGMTGWTVSNQNEDGEGQNFIWTDDTLTTAFGTPVEIVDNSGQSCVDNSGYVGFPSGWYQTDKTGDPSGLGAPPYREYIAQLTSPSIDLSDVTSGVSLEFNQTLRRLNGNTDVDQFTFVSWSIDGGESWVDTLLVNAEHPNQLRLNSSERIGLPGIEGQSNVKIKFLWDCDFYFWLIDNVKLTEREDNNLVITSFFAISPYAQTPISQVDPIYFVADINNNGAAEQTNVNLNIAISKDGNEVFSADKDYGTIASDATVADIVFNETYTPDELGSYTASYAVSSEAEEFDNSDNSRNFSFDITENLYAKETGRTRGLGPATSTWQAGNPHSWAIGSVYHINNNETTDSNILVDSVFVGVSTPSAMINQSILVFLYKWEDDNGNAQAEQGELTRIGGNEYEFTGDEADQTILAIALEDEEEDGNEVINLEADNDYIIMVQFTDPDEDTDDNDFFIDASEDYNYFAQRVVNSPVIEADTDRTGFGYGKPKYNYVLGVLDDPEGTFNDVIYDTFAFGDDLTPVIRMSLREVMVSNDDVLSDDNKINIFPNPTQNELNVSIELTELVEDATMSILDATGKVIFTKQYDNLKQGNFTFNTSALANGIYNLNVVTSNGNRATKFVVQK